MVMRRSGLVPSPAPRPEGYRAVQGHIQNHWIARRRLAETDDPEIAKLDVLRRVLALALKDPYIDLGLRLGGSEGHFAAAHWNGCVTGNDRDVAIRIGCRKSTRRSHWCRRCTG
jgi:hypothetical protein